MSKSFPQSNKKRGRRPGDDSGEGRASRVSFKRYLQDLKQRDAEEEMNEDTDGE